MGDMNGYTKTENDFLTENINCHDGFSTVTGNLELSERANMDVRKVNNYGRKILDMCLLTNLFIVNGRIGRDKGIGEYTCYFGEYPSVIDYCLVDYTLANNIDNFYVDVRNESHHMPLVLKLKTMIQVLDTETGTGINYLPKYILKNYDQNIFLDRFYSQDLLQLHHEIHNNNIDNAIELILKYITESAVEMKVNRLKNPGRENRNKNEPWFDLECLNMRSETFKTLKQFRKCRCLTNLAFFKESKRKLNTLYAHKKKIYEDKEKNEIIKAINEKNTKLFWSNVNKFVKKRSTPNITIPEEVWLRHFRNLFNPVIHSNAHFRVNRDNFVWDENLDRMISEDDIRNAVNNLRSGKSPGEDGIPAEFYKAIFPVIKEQLIDLFNKIFSQAYFPESWCNSLIIPIHKKGLQTDPNNYRGISLLSVFGKVFMNIMNVRISKWCERNEILCQEQGGFKKQFSTIDSVFVLETVIRKYLMKPKGRFYCAFVDFTKAFDLLNRDSLWYKLQNLNMSTKMLNMLMSIYRNVKARVLSNRGYTDAFQCPWGVKQGCILSPTLFNLYINDLPTFFRNRGTLQIPLTWTCLSCYTQMTLCYSWTLLSDYKDN